MVETGNGVEDIVNLGVEIKGDDVFAGFVIESQPLVDVLLAVSEILFQRLHITKSICGIPSFNFNCLFDI